MIDHRRALVDQHRLFVQTVFAAGPATPIPTCPGWTMRHLVRHVGRAQRWVAEIVRTGAGVDLDPRTAPDGRPPDDPDGARAWLAAGPDVLLEAIAGIGGTEMTVATFMGPQPARWWIRRLLHESTVHRADAAIATAAPFTLAPEIAADGVDEWLERLTEIPWPAGLPLGHADSVTVAATDVDATWTVERRGTDLLFHRTPPPSPAGARITGPATDLLLALVRRHDAERAGCVVDGDPGLWASFLERTPYAAAE